MPMTLLSIQMEDVLSAVSMFHTMTIQCVMHNFILAPTHPMHLRAPRALDPSFEDSTANFALAGIFGTLL